MARWILKTEPDSYSFERLMSERDAVWDGVSNPVALGHIRQMKPGDQLLIYHTGSEKQCVGLAEVTSEAYLDPRDSQGRLVVFNLRAGRPLKKPVTLAAVRAEPSLGELALVRMPRLSVVPVNETQWQVLMKLAEER